MPMPGLVLGALLCLFHLSSWQLAALSSPSAPVETAAHRLRTPAADFSIEHAPVCSGLAPEECCSQMLELAAFRAQGDQAPRLVKGLIRLACDEPRKVVGAQACRSIAALRGFRKPEVDAICGSSLRRCDDEQTCSQCNQDLKKLKYRGAQHACRALTYVKDE
jgi:hypothetical protein